MTRSGCKWPIAVKYCLKKVANESFAGLCSTCYLLCLKTPAFASGSLPCHVHRVQTRSAIEVASDPTSARLCDTVRT